MREGRGASVERAELGACRSPLERLRVFCSGLVMVSRYYFRAGLGTLEKTARPLNVKGLGRDALRRPE